jgi:hypothetical protein
VVCGGDGGDFESSLEQNSLTKRSSPVVSMM